MTDWTSPRKAADMPESHCVDLQFSVLFVDAAKKKLPALENDLYL